MRLQKYLAHAGVASRRKAEEMIKDGKVSINGEIVKEMGVIVTPENDIVKVNDKIVTLDTTYTYYMLHKPLYVISSADDEFGRKTVLDFVPKTTRVYPVGRLDFDSSGLILLTNDGALTHKLTHPSFEVKKKYLVHTNQYISKKDMQALEKGVHIDENFLTHSATVILLSRNQNESIFELEIHEGRNRQVRKMCHAIGHEVTELTRISMGTISLGSLPVGKYRSLSKQEIKNLKSL